SGGSSCKGGPRRDYGCLFSARVKAIPDVYKNCPAFIGEFNNVWRPAGPARGLDLAGIEVLAMHPAHSTSIREALSGYGFSAWRRPLQDGTFVAFATDTQTGRQYKAEAATEQAAWTGLAARLGVPLDDASGKPS